MATAELTYANIFPKAVTSSAAESYKRPLAVLTTLFFMWGFITIGIQDAFILSVLCYMYIVFYALRGSKPNSERHLSRFYAVTET